MGTTPAPVLIGKNITLSPSERLALSRRRAFTDSAPTCQVSRLYVKVGTRVGCESPTLWPGPLPGLCPRLPFSDTKPYFSSRIEGV